MADMGLFYTSFEIAHLERPESPGTVSHALLDTGSEYTWVPRPLLETSLEWRPDAACEPLVTDLPGYFAEVWARCSHRRPTDP